MKALVYTGVEALTYTDVPEPTPGPSEVLVRIQASGICGSDMHAFLGHDARRPAPLILGHEAAGSITGGARDGERVTINPLVTCGACPDCLRGTTNLCAQRQIISMQPRQGAFAQYVAMPESNLIAMPDHVPFEQAALAEPIACGWQGVRQALTGFTQAPAEIIGLVLGGGAIGVGAALSMKAQGIENVTIIEPNLTRRARLQSLTGIAVRDAEGTADEAPDLIVDAVGYAATRATASQIVRPGGAIVHIGLGEDTGGLDIRRMTLQGIRFLGIYTYTATDFAATAQAIFEGRMGALDWHDTRPLSEGARAFADIRAGATSAAKIILHPPSGS
jgi:threonine dehydrogenase-like Zn-dependent dehydrogenase